MTDCHWIGFSSFVPPYEIRTHMLNVGGRALKGLYYHIQRQIEMNGGMSQLRLANSFLQKRRDALIGSVAMADLMAASMSYSKPLVYSLHLLAVTNGNFSEETRNEAERNGIKLLDRHELMARLRSSSLPMGIVHVRENDRCASFNDGIRSARKWFDG